jgi:hypothetical protein
MVKWVIRNGERVLVQSYEVWTMEQLVPGSEAQKVVKVEWRDVPVEPPADGIYGIVEVVRDDAGRDHTVDLQFDVQAFAACLIEAFKEVKPGSHTHYIQGPKPDGTTTIDGAFNMPVVVKLALLRMKSPG